MHLIGRYRRIRGYSGITQEFTPPWLLDHKWGTARPCGGEEWWKSPSGVWLAVKDLLRDESGLVGVRGSVNMTPWILGFSPESGGGSVVMTTIALDSAYTAGSAGDAIAARFLCTRTVTLNAIYFYISSYVGTAANVNDIDYEVRTGSSTAPTTTGGALLTSGTVNPSSATGWIGITGLSQSLTGGAHYWIIIADANGNGTDHAVVHQRAAGQQPGGATRDAILYQACRTTAGFSAGATRDAAISKILAVFSDGTAAGSPYVSNTLLTNDSNQKGLYLSGVTEDISIIGATSDIASGSTLKVYVGSTGPSSGEAASGTTTIDFNNGSGGDVKGVFLSTPFTLEKGSAHRIVGDSAGNHQWPRMLTLGTGATTTMMKPFMGQGDWYQTSESGGAWADVNTQMPFMSIWLEDSVAAAASAAMIVHPGMAGGMRG